MAIADEVLCSFDIHSWHVVPRHRCRSLPRNAEMLWRIGWHWLKGLEACELLLLLLLLPLLLLLLLLT